MADLVLDGHEYDLAQAATFTLDEWQDFYDISHLTPDQLEDMEGQFHPGATKAMLVLTILRVRTDVTKREVLERVGQLTMEDLAALMVDAEDDADPPTGSQNGTGVPDGISGGAGTDGSTGDPAKSATPGFSGPLLSATSSVSDPSTSAE